MLEENPDTVIIQFGINDSAVDVWKKPSAAEPRVPLKTYETNLRQFVTALKSKNTEVILMTPNPLRWTDKLKKMYGKNPYNPADPDGFNVRLRDYAMVVRRLAKEESVRLIDVYQAFEEAGDVDALLLDGMHPNDRGHRLIADRLLRILE